MKLSLDKQRAAQTANLQFPKTHRLLVPSQYQRVFKKGCKRRGPLFTFFVCRNELSYARLGLAIAKRHEPLAVERNRIKRIIRESFRHYQQKLKGIDIVVLMQKRVHEISNTCLYQNLNQQWQNLMG